MSSPHPRLQSAWRVLAAALALTVACSSNLATADNQSPFQSPLRDKPSRITSHPQLVAVAQHVAMVCGGRLHITSEYRSPKRGKSRHSQLKNSPHTGHNHAQALDWRVDGGTCNYAMQMRHAYNLGVKRLGLSLIGYGSQRHIHLGWDNNGRSVIHAAHILQRTGLTIAQMVTDGVQVLGTGEHKARRLARQLAKQKTTTKASQLARL